MNKVIEEFPYKTTPAEIDLCVNDEDDDAKPKTAANKNEGIIHRHIIEN